MSETLAPLPAIKIRWIAAIFGALLIFVIIGAYSARMADTAPNYDSQRAAERIATLKKLQDADHETLTTAAWVDQSKGTVRIPIDEAMPQEVTALAAKPVQMGAVIPGAVTTMNTIPAAAENEAPAGAPNAVPGTNAAPVRPPPPPTAQ